MTPAPHRILIVDDSASTLELLRRNLASEGHTVFTAPSVAEAVRLLEVEKMDLVITDLKMPRTSGMDLVRHVRENLPDMEVMMITGYATLESAILAVKGGAEEYLSKPFTDAELSAAVERVLAKLLTRRAGRSPLTGEQGAHGIIGTSKAIRRVFRAISKAAGAAATVLVSGESGTGKELVARAIHYGSSRSAAPFVPVNCGGIPEPLLESELFGYVIGAFTGAAETRAGFFQTAERGTVFLDEVSEMSLSMQVRLLRTLQDCEIRMVGSNCPRKVDVRIVAATNKDLEGLVDRGLFRKDLYFRLNVVTIEVPPLSARDEDAVLLARHFAQKYASIAGKPAPDFSSRALHAFRQYSWPGNVRELENLVHRIIVMTDCSEIDITDLPPQMRFTASRAAGLDRTLAEVEAEHLRAVLESVRGNKTRAASVLGIDRKTLREKMKRHGLGMLGQ